MNHLFTTLPFIFFGAAIILLLANSDPRRKQLFSKIKPENHKRFTLSSANRKLLALSLVLPLIPLILMANYAGILMYAGALTTIGWAISELPSSVI